MPMLESLPGSVHLEPIRPSLSPPLSLQDGALFAGQPDPFYTFDLVPALCLHLPSLVHGPVPCSKGKRGTYYPKETRSQNVTQIYPQMTPRPTHRRIQRPTWRQTHTELLTCRDPPDTHRNTDVHTHTASCLRSTHILMGGSHDGCGLWYNHPLTLLQGLQLPVYDSGDVLLSEWALCWTQWLLRLQGNHFFCSVIPVMPRARPESHWVMKKYHLPHTPWSLLQLPAGSPYLHPT